MARLGTWRIDQEIEENLLYGKEKGPNDNNMYIYIYIAQCFFCLFLGGLKIPENYGNVDRRKHEQ